MIHLNWLRLTSTCNTSLKFRVANDPHPPNYTHEWNICSYSQRLISHVIDFLFLSFLIPQRGEVWVHKTSLTPPLVVEVHEPSQGRERTCICSLWVQSLNISLWLFGGFCNCADNVVFIVFIFVFFVNMYRIPFISNKRTVLYWIWEASFSARVHRWRPRRRIFRWCWLFHHLVFTNVSLCSIRFFQTSKCLLWILKLHKIILLRRDYQQDLCTTSWILKITEERFWFELHL